MVSVMATLIATLNLILQNGNYGNWHPTPRADFRADFLDTGGNIPIMRTSFFAGIAQLVERYLAKV